MASDNASTGPCRRAGVSSNDLPDGLALFDADSGEAYYLNPTATLIWEICDGRSEEDIARALADILEVDGETSTGYVAAGLEAFRANGIIDQEASGHGVE